MLSFDLHQLVNLYWALYENLTASWTTEAYFQCNKDVETLIKEMLGNGKMQSKLDKLDPIITSEMSIRFDEM